MVVRVNVAGSFSAQRFSKLADQVRADLASTDDWSKAYSGCDLDVYLHAFSYEQAGGYADEQRTAGQMKVAMGLRDNARAPAGAAIVAARLALYASLVHAGAEAPGGSPSGDSAAALAKTILLTWAKLGFRDTNGNFLNGSAQFCDARQTFDRMEQNNVGLQIARGVAYTVEAQDLIDGMGLLSTEERELLNRFHRAMYELIRSAANTRAEMPEFNRPTAICDRYSNHVGVQILGMVATARLLNDQQRLEAAAHGGSIRVDIPWTNYLARGIYGDGDHPLGCAVNTGTDRASSKPYFQTNTVAAGEINDRYRNANPGQGIGYPMFALRAMYAVAIVLDHAGFNAFDYQGPNDQSIKQATIYYACYGATPGFKKTVTSDNASSCTNYQQYMGASVSEVETIVLPGAKRYPDTLLLKKVEPAAKLIAAAGAVDPLLFGRWDD